MRNFRRFFAAAVLICGLAASLGLLSGCGYVSLAVASVKCKTCGGSGLCPVCGGDGLWGFFNCPACSGAKTCKTCGGLGFQSP